MYASAKKTVKKTFDKVKFSIYESEVKAMLDAHGYETVGFLDEDGRMQKYIDYIKKDKLKHPRGKGGIASFSAEEIDKVIDNYEAMKKLRDDSSD